MDNVQRALAAWVLVVGGIGLLAGIGYLAHAQSFGPGEVPWSNDPDGPRPRGNRAGERKPESKRTPIPEGESIWEDVPEDEITRKELAELRPGNFGVLEGVADFFDGFSGNEPEFRRLVFPFWQEIMGIRMTSDGEREVTVEIEVVDDLDGFMHPMREMEKQARARGRKMRPPGRESVLFIERVEIRDFLPGETEFKNPADIGLTDRHAETFKEMRKSHPEHCCIVRLTARMESITSEDFSARDMYICLVRKPDGWRICWMPQKE
jgi:hypothetical protein